MTYTSRTLINIPRNLVTVSVLNYKILHIVAAQTSSVVTVAFTWHYQISTWQ